VKDHLKGSYIDLVSYSTTHNFEKPLSLLWNRNKNSWKDLILNLSAVGYFDLTPESLQDVMHWNDLFRESTFRFAMNDGEEIFERNIEAISDRCDIVLSKRKNTLDIEEDFSLDELGNVSSFCRIDQTWYRLWHENESDLSWRLATQRVIEALNHTLQIRCVEFRAYFSFSGHEVPTLFLTEQQLHIIEDSLLPT